MNRDELESKLDRLGPDLGRWPAEDAAAARALLESDAEARRLADAAGRVAAWLAGLPADPAPRHLRAAILGRTRRESAEPAIGPPERMLQWLLERAWRPALLAMLLAVTGYLAGTAAPQPLDPALADDVVTLAFSDLYAELDDAQP